MKKTKLCLLALVLAGSTACKKNMRQIENNLNSTTYSTSKLGDTTVHKMLINGDTTYINEIKGTYYFSDDIEISTEQFHTLKRMSNPEINTTERSAIAKDFIRTWKDGIVYYEKFPDSSALTPHQHSQYIANIKAAMEMISEKTSIRFVERTNEPEYVRFQIGDINISPLGWTSGHINNIYIYTWHSVGVILHELLHTLGVAHEQSRSDRDQYITIHYDRAPDRYRNSFNIRPEFVPYGDFDFNSVMLYGPYLGSTNGLPIITLLDGSVYQSQLSKLSQGDYEGLNHLYNLSKSFTEKNNTYGIQSSVKPKYYLSYPYGASRIKDNTSVTLEYSWYKDLQPPYQFIFRKSKDRRHFIIKSKVDTTKVMTVRTDNNHTRFYGSEIVLSTYNEADSLAQEWRVHNLGNKGFSFESKYADGYCIRVEDNTNKPGKKFILVGRNESDQRQRFYLK